VSQTPIVGIGGQQWSNLRQARYGATDCHEFLPDRGPLASRRRKDYRFRQLGPLGIRL